MFHGWLPGLKVDVKPNPFFFIFFHSISKVVIQFDSGDGRVAMGGFFQHGHKHGKS